MSTSQLSLTSEDHRAEAEHAEKAGDWVMAFSHWVTLQNRVADSVQAWAGAGKALLSLGRFDAAATHFSEMVPRFPDSTVPYHGLARCAEHRGGAAAALGLWEAFLHRFPSEWSAWTGYGSALVKLGRFGEAETFYERMRDRFPGQPWAWEVAAKLAQHQGDRELALTRWRSFRARFPDLLRAWVGVGNAELALGRWHGAEVEYRNLLARFPDAPQGREGLARVASLRGDWSACAVLSRGLLESEPGMVSAHLLLIGAISELGREPEMIAAATAMSRAVPQHPRGWEVLLDDAWRRGNVGQIAALQEGLSAKIQDANHRFALRHRIALLSSDLDALQTAAEAALRVDPTLVEPYRMLFRACRTGGYFRELLHWAHRRLESAPDDGQALSAAFDALLALGHYHAAYDLVRKRTRGPRAHIFLLWNLLVSYYAALSNTSDRARDHRADRHLVRLCKAVAKRWPHERGPLERLRSLASTSRELQVFVTDQAQRYLPDASAFLLKARAIWLLAKTENEVDDTENDWLALRAVHAPCYPPPGAKSDEALDICRMLFACDDRSGLADMLDALTNGDEGLEWRAKAAVQVLAAATHWFRDPVIAARAFHFASQALWTRLHAPLDAHARMESALLFSELAADLLEALYFEQLKPDFVPTDERDACSSSFFLSKALAVRFRPFPKGLLDQCFDKSLIERLRVALRYVMYAQSCHPASWSRMSRTLRLLQRLLAFRSGLSEATLLRHVGTLGRLASRVWGSVAPSGLVACANILFETTKLLNISAGREALSDEDLRSLLDRVASRSAVKGAPSEHEEQLQILATALRTKLGDETELIAARDRIKRRKGRLAKDEWVGLFDFRRSRECFDGVTAVAAADRLPVIASWPQALDSTSCTEGSGDYVVLVSCDARYLLKFGWQFLATLNAEPKASGLLGHVHLHVVNPTTPALERIRTWQAQCCNLLITTSIEDRPGADTTYYAMARYLVLEWVRKRYQKAILVSDIDFWSPKVGLDALIAQLRRYDFGVYDDSSLSVTSLLPWISTWSGLVWLSNTDGGRAVLTDMCRSATQVVECGELSWYIDQNLFCDRLPVWKRLAGAGYVNLRSLDVYGGRYLMLNHVQQTTRLARYACVDTVTHHRVQERPGANE